MTVPTFAEVVAHPQRFLDRIKFDNEAVAAHLERNAPNPDPEEFAQFAGMSSSGADAVWLAYMFAPASEVAENVFTLVDMLAVMPGRDRVRFVSPSPNLSTSGSPWTRSGTWRASSALRAWLPRTGSRFRTAGRCGIPRG